MSDLLVLARENDLPPKWDGRAVVWLGWEYVPPMFVCPPRPEVCVQCGMSTTERGFPCWSANKGMLADSTWLTVDDYSREEANRARLPQCIQYKAPRHWWLELHAFRCHYCQLDTVWDTTHNETWTLDHTDYGSEGSVAP